MVDLDMAPDLEAPVAGARAGMRIVRAALGAALDNSFAIS